MKKITLGIIALVVIAAIGFVAVNNNDGTMNSSSEDMASDTSSDMSQTIPENTVIMDNLAYMPTEITVKKGTTVTWENRDTARHDVNFTDPSMDSADSDLFGQGETYEYTFNEVGTFDYSCTPHPFMQATVIVTE